MSVDITVTLPRDVAAVGEARRRTREALIGAGFGPEHLDDITLAVSEACTNAIEHADGTSPFSLRIEASATSVRLTVTSAGAHATSEVTGHMPAATAIRGRGVPLIRAFMDHVDITQRESNTIVTMIKRIAAPESTPAAC